MDAILIKNTMLVSIHPSMNIIKRNYQQLHFSDKKWFDNCEFFSLYNDLENELIQIKKHYIDIPINARNLQKSRYFSIIAEIPLGKYEVDEEESNEDELVIYYN
jgi:hypothetical protein